MKAVKYLGSRARTVQLNKNLKPTEGVAERVVIVQWIDDAHPKNGGHPAGTVVAKHVRGDGRFRDEFHIFAEETFDTLEAAYKWAEERFAAVRRSRA